MIRPELKDTFLQLVRLGIGTSKNVKISNDIDWVAVKALADAQGLTAIVLDGLNEVLKAKSPISNLKPQILIQEFADALEWNAEVEIVATHKFGEIHSHHMAIFIDYRTAA